MNVEITKVWARELKAVEPLMRITRLPKDIQHFLADYPDNTNDSTQTANLQFYSNTRQCQPDNLLISKIHARWLGDYETLEKNHGFIQWLFPIREHGMNFFSQPLQLHEIEAMKSDSAIGQRIICSYRLMLDFYGMKLINADTGLLGRVVPPRNYSARYHNLVRRSHNYLRISRILKCLSELGLERFNAGFVLHILSEQSEFNELNTVGIVHSMDHWWSNCFRNAGERAWIGDVIRKVRLGKITFTREMYIEALERRKCSGSFG